MSDEDGWTQPAFHWQVRETQPVDWTADWPFGRDFDLAVSHASTSYQVDVDVDEAGLMTLTRAGDVVATYRLSGPPMFGTGFVRWAAEKHDGSSVDLLLTPDDTSESEAHEGLRDMNEYLELAVRNCPTCLTPLHPGGSVRHPRWTCSSCRFVSLA